MEVDESEATHNCPDVSEPISGLPLTSVVDNCTKLSKLTCRLCAFEEDDNASTESSSNGWIVLSKRWFQATETVDGILKKYLREGLMVSSKTCFCT